MNVEVSIPFLQGKWKAPASKSELIRAIALAMQCEKKSVLNNVSYCSDVWTILHIAEAWGAEVKITSSSLKITGCRIPKSTSYLCGESALCLRLLIPLLSAHAGTFQVNATGSLLKRPMGELETTMLDFGGKIKTDNGYPPVEITNQIHSNSVEIEQPISSQGISGLLMALPLLQGDSHLKIIQPVSLPYIQLTMKFLNLAGISVQPDENFTVFSIKGEQCINPLNVSIEGDWSSASAIMVASAIYGNIKFENLNPESFQPDKKIVDLLPHHSGTIFHIKSSNALKGFKTDITHCPDLFPALVLLASHAESTSKITGIHRLLHKESNRLTAFINEFSKFGVEFAFEENTLLVNPCSSFNAAVIDSHNDHRIAMAAALAVTGTKQKVVIQNAECVSKSYPSFWEDIKCLGAKVKIIANGEALMN